MSHAMRWGAGQWIKRDGAEATRCDRPAIRYEATVHVAAFDAWL